jgi:hypothetical protein
MESLPDTCHSDANQIYSSCPMSFLFDEDVESRMLANDPSITSVCVRTDLDTTPVMDNYLERAERALTASRHVVELDFSFCLFRTCIPKCGCRVDDAKAMATVMATPFVEWIQSSATLNKLRVSSYLLCHSQIVRHLLPVFLHALSSRVAQGLHPLESLSVFRLTLNADDVVALLDNALLKDLQLPRCGFKRGSFPSEDIAQRRVAQAFGANSSIINLALGYAVGSEAFFCAILDALQSNVTVENLTIQRLTRFSNATSALVIGAIGSLLRSTIGPITNVHLDGFNWMDNLFDPIANSIQTSPKIQSLEFSNCYFHLAAFHQLCSIFSHGSTTSCLSILSGVEFLHLGDNSHAITEIIQTSPTLRQLSMFDVRTYYNEVGRFQAILNGIASISCSVERLLLDSVWDAVCPAFFQAIASFHKVQYVSFCVSSDFNELRRKELMAAFRCNGTLLDSNATGCGLNASDQARLHAYHQRNRHLQTLIHSMADLLISADSRDLGGLLPTLLHVSMNGAACTARRDPYDALLCCGDSIGAKRSSQM